MSAQRLTPHQRYYLDRLKHIIGSSPGYVDTRVVGGKAVWYRLLSKGYIEMDESWGPRGGNVVMVRPTPKETTP